MTNVFLAFLRISLSTSLVIVALVLLSPFLNKRYASKWKYWIWILIALRLIIPFNGIDGTVIGDTLSQLKDKNVPTTEKNVIDSQFEQVLLNGQIVVEIPPQMTTPISMQHPESNINFTLLDIISFVWLLGSLVFMLVHLSSYLYYKRQVAKKGISIMDTRILCQITEFKREMHIKSTIYAVKFTEVDSPMIIGFLRPILILPEEQYTTEELFFILKHELIHCKRKDVYVKLLFLAANAVHWFNPLIWIMQKEAAIDMELSCDERVTQGAGYDVRKAYTETLFTTLHKNTVKRTALSTQFYGGTQIMKKRFKNILYKAGKKNGVIVLISVAILAIGLGMLVGCLITDENAEYVPDRMKNESIFADAQAEDIYKGPEEILFDDSMSAMELPMDGQIYGYLTKCDTASATIDRQVWVTPESEDWKPEYSEDAGFEVVDVEGEDIVYPLFEDCAFSVLENHHYPVVELDEKEFESYLLEMEYPVLWIIQLEGGQIKDIREQYVP